jgi:hypothetical protein
VTIDVRALSSFVGLSCLPDTAGEPFRNKDLAQQIAIISAAATAEASINGCLEFICFMSDYWLWYTPENSLAQLALNVVCQVWKASQREGFSTIPHDKDR